MDKYIGKRLDGRYEIHELIGVGGMANVYRCNDTVDDREVAIKILKDEYLNNEEFIRRFKNESKAIAMLSHPNIVKVYDVSFGDMIQYIVMEYIDGITLKEYIESQGIIEWKDVIHLMTQVLKALQHAHESGIVHRDIKPQNIMLLQDGTIKVTDFGIARFSDKATRTMTDQAIGSVHYIAPEQAKGSVTDGKTDIYSVGVMLYEMLTGRLPFDGDSAVTVALMQLQSTPKRPREVNPGIPIGLEQITIRAMQKQPEDRYASAAEMLSDLERFRLNPSIVFDYGNNFIDRQPTKHVGVKDEEDEGNKVDKKDVDMPEPEYAYDEEPIKEHKPIFHVLKGIIIATIIMLLVFSGIGIFQAMNSGQAKDVDVPNFVGKTIVEVKEDNPEEFQFDIKSKFVEGQEIGVIIDQEPEAGSMKVKSGSTVKLTVNGTDTEIPVPFIQNLSENDAIKTLKEKSLIPKVVYVEDTKTPKGYTINSFPCAGAKTMIGSTVDVYVANGERAGVVEIPGVLGMNESEAKSALEELGLTVEIVNDDESKEAKDSVISSSPLPYGKVEKGTVVTLTVSTGKGDKRTVEVIVDLPPNVTETLEMRVTVDGAVDNSLSKTVNPAVSSSVTLNFEGTGKKNVVIELDDQVYREYTIDFDIGAVTNTVAHDFVVETEPPTEPVVTEPATYIPPATQATEAAPEQPAPDQNSVTPY